MMVQQTSLESSKILLWYDESYNYDPIETEEFFCLYLDSADKSPKTANFVCQIQIVMSPFNIQNKND